jgi:hypothetical protein
MVPLARLLSRSSRHVLRSCASGCVETVESAATSAERFDARSFRGGSGSFGHVRFSTLVSWGVNGSGECGVSQGGAWDTHAFKSLVSSPTEVLEDGLGFSSISAGLAHGAAVVSDGTVFTFGKGSNGELGTGRMDPVLEASRVEHLVDHHRIRSVAAGRTCTWFLNEEGNVLGCGTYATGAAYGMEEHWGFSGSSGSSGPLGAMGTLDEDDMLDGVGGLPIFAGGRQGTHQHGIGMMDAYGNFMRDNVKSPSAPAQHPGHSLQHFIPFIDHRARSIEVQQSKYLFSDPLRSMAEIDSAQRVWGDIAELSRFSENVSLPTLTGGAGLMGRVVGSSQNMLNRNSIASLGTCLYSGRTLAINSEGLPVVVEALRPTRALPMDPLSMPASWAQSSMPPPVVISVVEDNGGAVKAVVGEDWYAVLCRDGRVVVWWREDGDGARAAPGGSSRRRTSLAPAKSSTGKRMKVKTIKKGGSVFCTQDGTAVTTISVGVVGGIREVSASLGELFVSDGQRVWRLSIPSKNRMDAIARIKMDDATAEHGATTLIMDVGDAQVRKMDVNTRGTVATVTDSGHLWILGDVVSESDLSYVIGRQDEKRGRIWEGIRSVSGSEAVLVPGLHGVSDVSLGEHHALAVVA